MKAVSINKLEAATDAQSLLSYSLQISIMKEVVCLLGRPRILQVGVPDKKELLSL